MSNAALTTMILGALMSFTGQAFAQDVVTCRFATSRRVDDADC